MAGYGFVVLVFEEFSEGKSTRVRASMQIFCAKHSKQACISHNKKHACNR